ncbi:MAG: ATP-grasp domain-containing protein [Verrucomicrobia bacterium]|nr:ATP-grasp domain-containing protein [Verrucomicrobiota bacterium]
MFRKVLIANRGEICCRIAATAARLGIRTVAVFSDPDRTAKHTNACDEAIGIGGTTAAESYLSVPAILRAARITGVEAIHPGYGFLAENSEFVEACEAAGFTFIGPPAAVIKGMGDKGAAKRTMQTAGIPVAPGYQGDNQEPTFLQQQAGIIGYPVLLKARAGGGGKGLRLVENSKDFLDALASCRREAKSSFGDDTVLIEKHFPDPRHIEVQIFGDSHGNYVHLFERDCSVQRRHQKIIEEAPGPGLTGNQRHLVTETAVAAARTVNYVNAGTIEFLLNQDGQFYFMEMNTRLQVEHPVTELTTGQDLVEWQFRVAAGQPLPLRQDELAFRGHAIEARIYAERPGHNFLPSTGKLRVLRTPAAIYFRTQAPIEASAVRLDSGVNEGDMITPYYDPLLAKLIIWDRDRITAITNLRSALDGFVALGVETNINFLRRAIGTEDFLIENINTGLIARNEAFLLKSGSVVGFDYLILSSAGLLQAERLQTASDLADPYSPWAETSGWRLNSTYSRAISWSNGQETFETTLLYPAPGSRHSVCRLETGRDSAEFEILEQNENCLTILTDGRKLTGRVYINGNTFDLFFGGEQVTLTRIDALAYASQIEQNETQLTAPMPGRIVAVLINENQVVPKGTPLITMEAMKMEHTIVALADGRVDKILVNVADQVAEGAQLLQFTPNETANETANGRG